MSQRTNPPAASQRANMAFPRRGQLSVELLIVGALLAATALLAANYVSQSGESTGQSSKLVEAQLLGAQVARVANAACVSGASVSLEIECPSSEFIDLSSGESFTVQAGGGPVRARTACPIANGLTLHCSGVDRTWLCIAGNGEDGTIGLSEGRCA